MAEAISSVEMVELLRAAGETTRLRLLHLLAHGEYNVKDLTQILSQSQPRLSRHLKLLTDAGLIERFQEGSSVFFRYAEQGRKAAVLANLLSELDREDATILRDQSRVEALKLQKSEAAQVYFQTHADRWDRIRALHAPEAEVEAAMSRALGPGPFSLLVDLGTGTGRILELFSGRAERTIGFDVNRDMLSHARARLAASGIRNAQLRLGDIFDLPLDQGAADAIIIHQVLHFLDDPDKAVMEAAGLLKPGGRLLIVDFDMHGIEAFRENYAHQRLGFERKLMEGWLRRAGLNAAHFEAIKPSEAGDGKLTVSLWLAEKPAIPHKKTTKTTKETISEGS